MTTVATPPTPWQWSSDVLAYARQNKVDRYLDPLLIATQQLFPTAVKLRVGIEIDQELPNTQWIVFHVEVPSNDVPDYLTAHRTWTRELFRICPAPLVCTFVCRLLLVDA